MKRETHLEKHIAKVSEILKKRGYGRVNVSEIRSYLGHQRRKGYSSATLILESVIDRMPKKRLDFEGTKASIKNLSINGIGPVALFDITKLITRSNPKGLHLHAGTRAGYDKYCKSKGLPIDKRSYIPKKDLPLEMTLCNMALLEDILCIDKSDLNRMYKNIRRASSPEFRRTTRYPDLKVRKKIQSICTASKSKCD